MCNSSPSAIFRENGGPSIIRRKLRQSLVLRGFYRTNLPATILQQVAFEGPLGARLIEVVVPTHSPRSRYADATRAIQYLFGDLDRSHRCRQRHHSAINPHNVPQHLRSHRGPASGNDGTGHPVLCLCPVKPLGSLCSRAPTPTRLQVLGALVAKAIVRADPSLLPKRTFSFR